VYRSGGGGQLAEVARLAGHSPGGRFGATLAAVGDLDRDGYQDFAVAAPYEDEGRGVVYIYRGGSGTFATTPSQQLSARIISDSLRGFGASISRGVDIDDNAHPDLAVGAYVSGEVVLLRTNPVIRFTSSLTSSPERLTMSVREFQTRACLSYTGATVDTITMDVSLRMESFHAQGAFRLPDGGEAREVNFTMEVRREDLTCRSFDVSLLEAERIDYTKPLQMSMRYKISGSDNADREPSFVETDTEKRATNYTVASRRRRRQIQFPAPPRRDSFCSSCPVPNVNLPSQQLTTLSVPFAVGCGEDAICQTDLRLSHSFTNLSSSGGAYVIGSTSTLELVLRLENSGEPASLAQVIVSVPAPVSLLRLPSDCTEQDAEGQEAAFTLTCRVLPHPFYNTSEYRLPLVFDMDAVTGDVRKLVFNVSTDSASVELFPADNVANISLPLMSQADVEIRGKARDAIVVFESGEGARAKSEFIQHTYQVSKYGPTPVRAVNVSFLVPLAVLNKAGEEVDVVEIYTPAAFLNSQPLTCVLQEGEYFHSSGVTISGPADHIDPLVDSDLQATESTWAGQVRPAGEVTEQRRRQRRATVVELPSTSNLAVNSDDLLMDCESVGAAARCARVLCQTVSLLETGDRVTVTLQMRVDLAALSALGAPRVLLSTAGRARILDTDSSLPASANSRPDTARVTTQLLTATLAPEEVPTWIVVVAVLGALLLLALITQGLHLAGFFRRTKQEEMEEVQRAEAEWTQAEPVEKAAPVEMASPVAAEVEEREDFGNMFIVPGRPGGSK